MMDDTDRAQVGIGTLVIFIALVLVAAVAASTLIDTAGLLQGRAESTGDQSSAQVTNQIDIVSGSIAVDHDGSTNGGPTPESGMITLTVKKAPGSEAIDLTEGTISYRSETTTQQLVHAGSASDSAFTTSNVKGASNDVLSETDARAQIKLNPALIESDAEGIGESESATIQYTTSSGGTATVEVSMPGTVPSDQGIVQVDT